MIFARMCGGVQGLRFPLLLQFRGTFAKWLEDLGPPSFVFRAGVVIRRRFLREWCVDVDLIGIVDEGIQLKEFGL